MANSGTKAFGFQDRLRERSGAATAVTRADPEFGVEPEVRERQPVPSRTPARASPKKETKKKKKKEEEEDEKEKAFGRTESVAREPRRGATPGWRMVVYKDGRTLVTQTEPLRGDEAEGADGSHLFEGVALSIDAESPSAWLEDETGRRAATCGSVALIKNPWAAMTQELNYRDRILGDPSFAGWLRRQPEVRAHLLPVEGESAPPVVGGRPVVSCEDGLILFGGLDRDEGEVSVVTRTISHLRVKTMERPSPGEAAEPLHSVRAGYSAASRSGASRACLRYTSRSFLPAILYEAAFRERSGAESPVASGMRLCCYLRLEPVDRLGMTDASVRFVNTDFMDAVVSDGAHAVFECAVPRSAPRVATLAATAVPRGGVVEESSGENGEDADEDANEDEEGEGVASGKRGGDGAAGTGFSAASYSVPVPVTFERGSPDAKKFLLFEEEVRDARLLCRVDTRRSDGRMTSLAEWKTGERFHPEGVYDLFDGEGLQLGRILLKDALPGRRVEAVLGDAPDVSYRFDPASSMKDPVVEGDTRMRYRRVTHTLRLRSGRPDTTLVRVSVRLPDQTHEVTLKSYDGERISPEFAPRKEPVNDEIVDPKEQLLDVRLEGRAEAVLVYVVKSPILKGNAGGRR